VFTAQGAGTLNVEGVKMLDKVRARLSGEYNNGAQYVSLKQQAIQAARAAATAAGQPPNSVQSVEPVLPSNALEVRGQVHRLMREASSDENLSAMYLGWMPFL
jgi:hypothetical protein